MFRVPYPVALVDASVGLSSQAKFDLTLTG